MSFAALTEGSDESKTLDAVAHARGTLVHEVLWIGQ
jgi:hypothetical protein